MACVTYDLGIKEEQLQSMAEKVGVWNFAKKARKVLNVFSGDFPKRDVLEYAMLEQYLKPAMKYAGVKFSKVEWRAFLQLILVKEHPTSTS